MSSDQAFTTYFRPIMAEYEKLARDIGITDEKDVSIWSNFCATFSDHAADQKKWNRAFLDMVSSLRPESAGKAVGVMLFCGMHRAQIASRDVATEINSWAHGHNFEAEKAGQGRYDDFKNPVYSTFICGLYTLLKNEHVKALWASTRIPRVPLRKVTPIRFLTYDVNAYHIGKRWTDIEEFLPTLVQRSETSELASKLLDLMHDKEIETNTWLLGVTYQKFFQPHCCVLEKHPSNLEFNTIVLSALPRLKEMILDPKRFYESGEKVGHTKNYC